GRPEAFGAPAPRRSGGPRPPARAPRSGAQARAGSSRTPGNRYWPCRLSGLHQADYLGAKEALQGSQQIVSRIDAEPAGPEPNGLSVPVRPLNIDRASARMGRAEGHRVAELFGRRRGWQAPA